VLVPVCVLAGWNEITDARGRHFFALILLLETFMIGVFVARDVFLFYVFFEAMLIPVYFLIGQFGGAQRRYAAVKFLLYSLLGGLVMLVAVIGLYAQGKGGPQGFLTSNLTGLPFSSDLVERALFLGFFFAFAVKAPMWPVHTWLPDAAAEAPAGVAVLLVGVLDKVGTFGMLTLCLPLFPGASKWAAPVVLVLAVVSVIYGALLAIGQSDLKRLIAYTSISHFGFIVLGIFAFTSTGQAGSTLYMVNHGFSTAALFLVAGMVIARRGSQRIDDYGGLQRATPLLAGSFLVAGLSSLALPGLSSFVSEFLVLVGTFTRYPVAAVVATAGIILASLYILLTYQRMFTGPRLEFAAGWRDMDRREAWVVAPLIAVILALGVFPKPVLDVLNPAVGRTMEQTRSTDPAPTVAGVPAAEGTTP
jgi:NADH-quinone oxidoreductase subunit M